MTAGNGTIVNINARTIEPMTGIVGHRLDQHDLANLVQRRAGRGFHDGKRLLRYARDRFDDSNRVARGKLTAEAGCHQEVARLDIGIIRKIRDIEFADFARAECNRPETVAIDLDGNRVAGVADQHCERRLEARLDDLADHAICVDECLAVVDAIGRTHIDDEGVPVGVCIDCHDLGNPGPARDALSRTEQLAQPRVFGLQRRDLLQFHIDEQPLIAQPAVFALQVVAADSGLFGP